MAARAQLHILYFIVSLLVLREFLPCRDGPLMGTALTCQFLVCAPFLTVLLVHYWLLSLTYVVIGHKWAG